MTVTMANNHHRNLRHRCSQPNKFAGRRLLLRERERQQHYLHNHHHNIIEHIPSIPCPFDPLSFSLFLTLSFALPQPLHPHPFDLRLDVAEHGRDHSPPPTPLLLLLLSSSSAPPARAPTSSLIRLTADSPAAAVNPFSLSHKHTQHTHTTLFPSCARPPVVSAPLQKPLPACVPLHRTSHLPSPDCAPAPVLLPCWKSVYHSTVQGLALPPTCLPNLKLSPLSSLLITAYRTYVLCSTLFYSTVLCAPAATASSPSRPFHLPQVFPNLPCIPSGPGLLIHSIIPIALNSHPAARCTASSTALLLSPPPASWVAPCTRLLAFLQSWSCAVLECSLDCMDPRSVPQKHCPPG